MSHFVRVEKPVLPPGHCFTCFGGHDLEQVDTLRDDGNWRLYVCSRCVTGMARLFGMLPVEEVEALRDRLDANERTVGELQAMLELERNNKVLTVSDAVALVDRIRESDAAKASEPAAA